MNLQTPIASTLFVPTVYKNGLFGSSYHDSYIETLYAQTIN